MRSHLVVLSVVALLPGSSCAAQPERVTPVDPYETAPAAVAKPVIDDYFGTKITDRFRYIEEKAPETIAWMKAQGAHTRKVMDSIAPRGAFYARFRDFGARFGQVSRIQIVEDRLFFLERAPGAEVFNLVVRDAAGHKRVLVNTAARVEADGGEPQAVDYFSVSPDGARVAVGMSAGGSEQSKLTIVDVATGKVRTTPVDRAQSGAPSWLDDSSGLFITRRQATTSSTPAAERYLNTGTWFWNLKNPPIAIAGAKARRGPISNAAIFPVISVTPGAGIADLIGYHGVSFEIDLWTAPAADAARGQVDWRHIATPADAITDFARDRERLYLLTHKDAPTYEVIAVAAQDADLANARTVIPARPERVIQSIHAAADGLYAVAREGLWSRLLRVSGSGVAEDLRLPIHGTITAVVTNPRKVGVTIEMTSWTQPATHYRLDPATGDFEKLGLETGPAIDQGRYTVAELKVRSHDGVMVPLSLLTATGPRTPRPLLLEAYGAYGIVTAPSYSQRNLALLDAGASVAVCHVRGGGELGTAWHLAGKGPTKPNSWKDLIACAQTLIAQRHTTADQLTITGGSAAGSTVGRAATERPELFAGVIARYSDLNPLRGELMPSGPANIHEFGSVQDPEGFKALLAMDSYHHVRDGVRYPAFLLTTGLNDPRVEPWAPAKMAARLLETPDHRPVLLRVQVGAGHGRGETKSMADDAVADFATFLFWRAGVPAWQPSIRPTHR